MANLVTNGDFEACVPPSLSPGWTGGGFFTATSTIAPRTGTICAFLGPTASSGGVDAWIDQLNIPTVNGKQYLLSFWSTPDVIQNTVNRVYINDFINPVLTYSLTIPSTYIQITHIFTATGPTDLRILSTAAGILAGSNATRVDDVSITEIIICFLGRSLVYTKDNQYHEEKYIEAKNLDKETHQVFSLAKMNYVPIKKIITCGPYDRFFLLEKNSLSNNSPNEDLYITSGHAIMYHGKETKVRDIPEAKIIKIKPEMVYSIVTGESEPLLINNVPVLSHNNTNV